MIKPLVLAAISFAAAYATPATQAETVLSTLGQNYSAGWYASASDNPIALSFQTGPTQIWSLDEITLKLIVHSPSSDPLTVQLWSDLEAQPGAALTTLVPDTLNPATSGNYSYSTDVELILSAGTSYWIVLLSTSESSYNIANAPGSGSTSDEGWTVPTNNFAFSNNGGESWNAMPDGIYGFEVSATAVPEPSSYLLLGIGVAAATLAGARKRKNA